MLAREQRSREGEEGGGSRLGLEVLAEERGGAVVPPARESRSRMYEHLQQQGEGGGGGLV